MPSTIRIPIPANLQPNELHEFFQELIGDDHKGKPGILRPALNLDLEDDRAAVDLITVESVGVDVDSVFVHFRIDYSAYHGCRDMNYQDEDYRAVKGARDGSEWVFEIHVSPEPLAPNEEL